MDPLFKSSGLDPEILLAGSRRRSDDSVGPDPSFEALRNLPKKNISEESRRLIKERVKRIFTNYETLHEILQRHELLIQKRWAKKSRKQRLKILLKTWPEMPAGHRPEFEMIRKKVPLQRGTRTKWRDCFLMPYINQEDLSGQKPLLLLLHARGRHSPSEFAAADAQVFFLGILAKALETSYSNGWTMILNGTTDAKEYGNLVAWDSHPHAYEWLWTRKQFIPGEGMLVLEAQDRILSFLVECCVAILHDIPREDLTSDLYPIQAIPIPKSDEQLIGFESLAVMAAEAPYRVPAQFDLGRVESLLAAKVSAEEDHVWALREDPGYFAEHVLEVKAHRREILKDEMGDPHPDTMKGREDLFWARILANVIADTYLGLEMFCELQKQARELCSLEQKYKPLISPKNSLPSEYLDAILKFRHYLEQAAKRTIRQICYSLVASPPMRRFTLRDPANDGSTTIRTKLNPKAKINNIEAHFMWLMESLCEESDNLFHLIGVNLVVDELDRLIQSEPRVRELVSAYISGLLGSLTIISQCLAQLELYQPWARHFLSDRTVRECALNAEYIQRDAAWMELGRAINEQNLQGIAKLGNPSGGKFIYPIEKRRTRENVETLRQAERNLDIF